MNCWTIRFDNSAVKFDLFVLVVGVLCVYCYTFDCAFNLLDIFVYFNCWFVCSAVINPFLKRTSVRKILDSTWQTKTQHQYNQATIESIDRQTIQKCMTDFQLMLWLFSCQENELMKVKFQLTEFLVINNSTLVSEVCPRRWTLNKT
jgi:hypothetical protein